MKQNKYDFLIVGAGFFGATMARMLSDKGYRVLIMEKNKYVGGLCADENIEGILVTKYGPHVISTNNIDVWKFLNKYGKMNSFSKSEVMKNKNILYHLPIDSLTFSQVYGTITIQESYKNIMNEVKNYNVKVAESLEDECIIKSGLTIYSNVLKNFYEKMFGKKCSQLAVSMPNMIPITYNYCPYTNTDLYAGVPINGFTNLVENIIGDDIPIMLGKDFLADIDGNSKYADLVIYTGPLDALCHYVYGSLNWCTASFSTMNESLRGNYIYGIPIININDLNNNTYRITEHKWFHPEKLNDTKYKSNNIVTYEEWKKWEPGDLTLYAIIDKKMTELVDKYVTFVNDKYPNIILGGKNALFANMTIGETVEEAIKLSSLVPNKSDIIDESINK